MKPFGNFKKGILNIGEAPGEWEDRKGKQWQGKVGQLLQKTYAKLGIDLFEDCLNINSANCRPTDEKGANRPPSNYEIQCCRKIVFAAIEQYKPKVIVLFGNSPLFSIIEHRWKKDLNGITEWRGWTIPDQELKTWICPVFHPSYVDRQNSPEVNLVWENDLQRAISMTKVPFSKFIEPKINVIEDLTELESIPNCSTIAFDFETTGLKPHLQEHKIICASVAYNENEAFVFEIPKTKRKLQPFLNLLENKTIQKMAHNMKYEKAWSEAKLGVKVKNWYWDSMLAAHILDNRTGITGLKFQSYVNFGIIDYSSHIEKWLKAKDANSLNKLQEYFSTESGKNEVLKYCGYDSVLEFRLAMKQISIINGL